MDLNERRLDAGMYIGSSPAGIRDMQEERQEAEMEPGPLDCIGCGPADGGNRGSLSVHVQSS